MIFVKDFALFTSIGMILEKFASGMHSYAAWSERVGFFAIFSRNNAGYRGGINISIFPWKCWNINERAISFPKKRVFEEIFVKMKVLQINLLNVRKKWARIAFFANECSFFRKILFFSNFCLKITFFHWKSNFCGKITFFHWKLNFCGKIVKFWEKGPKLCKSCLNEQNRRLFRIFGREQWKLKLLHCTLKNSRGVRGDGDWIPPAPIPLAVPNHCHYRIQNPPKGVLDSVGTMGFLTHFLTISFLRAAAREILVNFWV